VTDRWPRWQNWRRRGTAAGLVFRLFSGRFQNFGADQKIFYLPGPNHLVGKGVWIPGSEVEPKRRTVDFHRPFFQAVDLAWASATFPSLPPGCRKVPEGKVL